MILTASDFHRNLGLSLAGFIALWGILSGLISAFQCGTSEPWLFLGRQDECFDLVRRCQLSDA
jgi:hypothetical protein